MSEKRERGGKVEVEVSKKSKERAREALKKKKTHRSLRDQRVLVPLELPLARGRGALHLDGQVVGDEDEAVGEVVCVEKGQEGKREVRAMARSRTRKSESASMTTLTTFFFSRASRPSLRSSCRKATLLPERSISHLPCACRRKKRNGNRRRRARGESSSTASGGVFRSRSLALLSPSPSPNSTHRELFLDASSESMDPLDPLAPIPPGKPPPRPPPTGARRGPPASSPSPSRMPEAASACRFL